MNFIKKHPTLIFGLLLTLAFLFITLVRVEFFDTLGLKLYDTVMKVKGRPDPSDTIVIVDIDDESIEKLGRWPWPRSLIARGIDKINEGDPSVIGLNIIYSEPEENAGLMEIDFLETRFRENFLPPLQEVATAAPQPARNAGPPLQETLDQVQSGFLEELDLARKRLDRDSILAASLTRSGRVVLPIFFKDTLVPDSGQPEEAEETLKDQAIGNVRIPPGAACPQATEAVLPIPVFRRAAAGMGHINVAPDHDGTYRRERMLYEYRGLFVPSYALVLAARYAGVSPNNIGADIGMSVSFKKIEIPVTPYSELLIGFHTAPDAFRHYSFFDVLNDKIPLRVFTNKIVLVSLSAKGLATPLSTPVAPSTTFGDFTAHVLWSVLNQQFIRQFPGTRLIELAAVLFLGLLITLVLPRLKAAISGGLFFVLLALLLGGFAWAFLSRGVWLDVIYPVLLLVIGYTGIVSIRYFLTEAGKEKVEGESAETNRMLGISFQSQGMLDMAFDKFRKVPMDDQMKDLLYNLALDYERKRQLNKAAAVYGYIEEYDNKFKDIVERKKKLLVASETMVFGAGFLGGGGAGDGMVSTDPSIRPTLGRYEILKQLGKGAMGVVYLGQDPRINRTTAIKTVRFSDEFDEEEAAEMKKKFFREAESAGTLSHPNIVTIYDAGDEQDLAYIAMEYLEGDSLEKFQKKESLIPMRRLIGYIADIAEGLDYAHRQGIVHRDIKPANVMLLKNGKVKITDFGIARITASSQTKTGIVKGTPYYMSPEQISGKKVDGRSDIFSLGVMTFQLLTGTVPFKGSSPAALMHKILNSPHPDPRTINPRIPKPLTAILNKALEKDPAKRYQTAGQMAAHLRTLGEKMDAAMAKKTQA
ncbi:CHASE2 domain-containing serine/threonine-protein kinase [Desulfosudis oleivorans]|uniref:non-specific serine/threonine protein kinase n=1 Tax=Desulfosudis oleivorans (strain DSM 6200 / JCM 39069 / Hxd3) TaxID=96561 RepID=A8ZYR6_DESOH|nr:serine/threonine-protein kinase [Desulfosudis oleivorans]ABW67171.1 serine/threonine protein kinase with Chase2 sensor [Desulfosudis oleivorans Hxd3]